jgi:uncharacterized membrane protein
MPNGVLGLFAVLYPLAIAFGQRWVSPRWLAAMLVAAVLARLVIGPRDRLALVWALAACAIAGYALFANDALPLRYYPVAINAGLLAVFGWSLLHPPTIIERFARLQEPDLPAVALPYVRRVTQVWCGFFIINGSISLATAIWASDATWALYNGFLSYLAMGVLFAVEWLVRQRVKRRIAGV